MSDFRRSLRQAYFRGRSRVLRRLRDLQPASVKRKLALVERTCEGAHALAYVFQGREMALMIEPMAFLRETGLLRANLVMLRDYNRLFWHAGISDEIPDVDVLRRRLVEARERMPGARETICLGSSAGGYGAILFGHYLGADAVYAFVPQTLIDLDRLRAERLREVGRDDVPFFPEEHRDLALLLRKHNGRTRYRIFYSEGHDADRGFAERLRGCPGVELNPQPGDTHLVVQTMHAAGRLPDLRAHLAPGLDAA